MYQINQVEMASSREQLKLEIFKLEVIERI